jgi:sigma-B regulation protein RsbU (phosphoserine phosphatase)
MFNKSIAYRLSIYISIAVISVFLAFILIAYYFNSNIIRSNIVQEAISLSSKAMMLGERQLVSTKEITSNVSDQALFFAQHNEVEVFACMLMKKYSFLNAIHININPDIPNIVYRNYYCFRLNDSIHFLQDNEFIYNCKNEKRIFESLTEKETPGWTEVFYCERNKNQVVAYYSPIRVLENNREKVTVGSVLIELSLHDLNDTINSLEIKESGYAFIVEKDGTYLTHPNKDYILKRNLFKIPEKEYKVTEAGVSNLLVKGETGSVVAYPEYKNYEKCWVFYTPMRETGWTLFFVVPYNELFLPLYLSVLRMLFFSVLGILVIFFIITFITNKLIQPLSSITSQLKKFSSENDDTEFKTRNEVILVSESLNYLKSWYEKFEIHRHQEEKLNSQRTQDLLEASEIQMSLINNDFSAFTSRDDVDLYAIYKPARIVSGDLFDFFFLDSENLFFSIGDVSGKGISAAFFMSVAQTILKRASKLKSPGKIVTAANNDLYTLNHHQFFLTLFSGVLNLKTGLLKYSNAAHTSTLKLNIKGELTELEQLHGMPLGLHPNREYLESAVKLNPGDSIILFSDGVTELQNINNQHFGLERFHHILSPLSILKPLHLIEEVENNLNLFQGKMAQADDITIMVLKYKDKKKA